MIKVLIADDEKKICQLIEALVDWAEFGMEIVGFAHDGEQALEYIETYKPDLVITDIRMPGKDGLEIIELGKKLNSELEFIIISGYKHFEYAQSAIKLGVNDYLLKPIKKSELLGTLSKLEQKFRFKTDQLNVDEKLKLSLKTNLEKIRNAFFSDYILKDEILSYEKPSIEYFNSKYHLMLEDGLFQILIINVDSYQDTFYKEGMSVFGSKIEEIIAENLVDNCFDFKTYIDTRRAICLLNYAEANRETIRRKIKDILTQLLIQSNIFDNLEITIAIGEAYDIENIKQSFRDAEEKSMQRIIKGRGKIIELYNKEDINVSDSILLEFSKNMSGAIEVLDEKLIFENINVLQRKLKAENNITGFELFNTVIEAVNLFLMLLRNYQFNTEKTKYIQEKFIKEFENSFSYEQLFSNMDRLIKTILDEVMTEKKQLEIKPIRAAKQYIQTNYMKHISLEEVSSIVGFSPAYFSSMFKKESGQNFMEYISEVRINKAKDFLKTTNWSIAVICESVGYSDLKHFTQIFKKYTGLKPNEFRKLYSWAGTEK